MPISGEYTISASLRAASLSMSVGFDTRIFVKIDGTLVKYLGGVRTQSTTAMTKELCGVPVTLRLNSGQKIKLGAGTDQNVAIDTNPSLQTSMNWISIMRTGN